MRPSTPEIIMKRSDSPRFTVQQIMLLQRLKQSGLTRGQILKGLDEIDKMDDIPASLPSEQPKSRPARSPPPLSTKQIGMNGNRIQNTREESASIDHTTQSGSPTSPQPTTSPSTVISIQRNPKMMTSHPVHPMHQAAPLMFGSHLQNPNQIALLHPGGNWATGTSRAVAAATAASLLHNGFPHHSLQQSMYPSLMNGRANAGISNMFGAPNGNAIVEIDGEKVDITEELDGLFRRDQAQVKEDIRKFINERHISQSAIAKATGNAISQSYISQWLAQPQDISGQKKKAMYTWFLIEKRKPPCIVGLSSSAPIVFRNNDMETDYAPPLCLKSKRGARFTWPKECLTILENYYNANPYPDESKREEIAAACNSIIHTHKAGMMLTELDRVTTVKVYNWFANRRKDDKRRKHIEQIEALDHHILRSPPQRSNTVSPSSSNHSADGGHVHDVTDHPRMSERVQADMLAMRKKEEEQMALALQMAAVNHSILALVNQHRGIISAERGEARSPPGGESERDDNDDNDSVECGSHQGNEKHQGHMRYRNESENQDHSSASKTLEMRRESSNAAMTQSPIQART